MECFVKPDSWANSKFEARFTRGRLRKAADTTVPLSFAQQRLCFPINWNLTARSITSPVVKMSGG